jgi:hypothetical protein
MSTVAFLDWQGLISTVVVVIEVDVDVVDSLSGGKVVIAVVLAMTVVVVEGPSFPSAPERNTAAINITTSTTK